MEAVPHRSEQGKAAEERKGPGMGSLRPAHEVGQCAHGQRDTDQGALRAPAVGQSPGDPRRGRLVSPAFLSHLWAPWAKGRGI